VGELVTPANKVRSTLGSRRGRGDDKLYARAMPQKVEITESYSVAQDISQNPSMELDGEGTGAIEMKIPYDGRDYFTRQAADDVNRRIAMRSGIGERKAIVGHLLLTDHAKTDLRNTMRRHNQVGVIPLAVPVTSADGSLKLTADRLACVIGYDYQPDAPLIYPIELDIKLYDPDNLTLNFYELETLTKLGKTKPSEVIEKLRQEASFSSELLLSIEVTISLPVKKDYSRLTPIVKRMSVDWPTITSLRTTRLYVPDRLSDSEDQEFRQVPVRYNPVKSRLEWEEISFLQPSERGDDGDAGVRIYHSEAMVLNIGHPGELFKEEKLEVNAEVEIPGYLLSGLEALLFDATGDRQGRQPTLVTRFHIRTDLYPADVFARRTFSPYQQFVFDDIIPDEMRITDIITVLRNSRFDVYDRWPGTGNENDSNIPKWLLMARRSQGPDELELLVAVEGKRDVMDREQIMADSMVKLSGNKESGQLRISVLGMLPRDHRELTREMNALQQALRDRFRFQQTSRR
jgi:hypothetical protein